MMYDVLGERDCCCQFFVDDCGGVWLDIWCCWYCGCGCFFLVWFGFVGFVVYGVVLCVLCYGFYFGFGVVVVVCFCFGVFCFGDFCVWFFGFYVDGDELECVCLFGWSGGFGD